MRKAGPEPGQLRGRRRHGQPPAADVVAVDLLCLADPPDFVNRRPQLCLQCPDAGRPAGPAGVDGARSGHFRCHPAAVAAGGAVPGERRLEDHDPRVRAALREVVRRPQAGVPTAHDADVRLDRSGQRRAPGREAAERLPPVGDFAISHGGDGTSWPRCCRKGVLSPTLLPSREVYSAPADPWTASFLGTANPLPGVLQNQSVRTALGWHEMRAGGQLPDGGGEVTVLIRPEQITLAPFARSAEGVTGKVTEARYRGHDALITVDVADAGVFQVQMLGTGALAPGDEVGLTAIGQVMVWPEGS